jgi:hypothetical protein
MPLKERPNLSRNITRDRMVLLMEQVVRALHKRGFGIGQPALSERDAFAKEGSTFAPQHQHHRLLDTARKLFIKVPLAHGFKLNLAEG